ncbi:hypothetical protein BKA58DRAFT_219089 [Alternaria rosae]|uniref:uncharacterized protein n=1 Tax=Alternaria rosae TaxID=1187941 RepID=UPI001E8DE7DF|nr:uncharacterized protein BKA58DRAFT_219089 [Alternaria rosae]KAH6867146.1 hypothetical protein BKA58DRAFT_219089 [Alternaria rosae]
MRQKLSILLSHIASHARASVFERCRQRLAMQHHMAGSPEGSACKRFRPRTLYPSGCTSFRAPPSETSVFARHNPVLLSQGSNMLRLTLDPLRAHKKTRDTQQYSPTSIPFHSCRNCKRAQTRAASL